jgi:hypothetical protein
LFRGHPSASQLRESGLVQLLFLVFLAVLSVSATAVFLGQQVLLYLVEKLKNASLLEGSHLGCPLTSEPTQ